MGKRKSGGRKSFLRKLLAEYYGYLMKPNQNRRNRINEENIDPESEYTIQDIEDITPPIDTENIKFSIFDKSFTTKKYIMSTEIQFK